MRFDKLVNNILRTTLNEAFTSSYELNKPTNFNDSTVFYTFKTRDGEEISVQFTNEYGESVVSPDNNILAAFGRRTSKTQATGNWSEGSWIEVETEELLNVTDRLQILSTVKRAVLDFINTFFAQNDEDIPLNINFYGSLTNEEIDQNKSIGQSKRANIYRKMFRDLPYNLKLYTLPDGQLNISND